jgi:hypothetical protein
MVVVKFGRGKGNSYEGHLGQLEAKIEAGHLPMTIKRLVRQLAKQHDVKDGEIEVIGLTFVVRKAR